LAATNINPMSAIASRVVLPLLLLQAFLCANQNYGMMEQWHLSDIVLSSQYTSVHSMTTFQTDATLPPPWDPNAD